MNMNEKPSCCYDTEAFLFLKGGFMRQEEYKALVQAAREADLVAYFQRNGFTVERKGS